MNFENENLINVVCLESKLSIDNIDELTEDCSGIDVYYIGIYDLSASLGLPGKLKIQGLSELEKMVKKIRNSGKVVGTYTDTVEQAKNEKSRD